MSFSAKITLLVLISMLLTSSKSIAGDKDWERFGKGVAVLWGVSILHDVIHGHHGYRHYGYRHHRSYDYGHGHRYYRSYRHQSYKYQPESYRLSRKVRLTHSNKRARFIDHDYARFYSNCRKKRMCSSKESSGIRIISLAKNRRYYQPAKSSHGYIQVYSGHSGAWVNISKCSGF